LNIKDILKDKTLTSKYVVLIFAVINSLLNLFGVQTISDTQVNDIATAITTLTSALMLLNVRAHELRKIKQEKE